MSLCRDGDQDLCGQDLFVDLRVCGSTRGRSRSRAGGVIPERRGIKTVGAEERHFVGGVDGLGYVEVRSFPMTLKSTNFGIGLGIRVIAIKRRRSRYSRKSRNGSHGSHGWRERGARHIKKVTVNLINSHGGRCAHAGIIALKLCSVPRYGSKFWWGK